MGSPIYTLIGFIYFLTSAFKCSAINTGLNYKDRICAIDSVLPVAVLRVWAILSLSSIYSRVLVLLVDLGFLVERPVTCTFYIYDLVMAPALASVICFQISLLYFLAMRLPVSFLGETPLLVKGRRFW